MTNRDTQTVLQPVLINRLDSKIQYLNQLELAINNNQVSKVYELLDSQKFNEQIRQREHADSNAHLSVLVSDLQNDIASFLAPELIDYLTSQFDFLTFNPVQDEPTLYDVYIGDWWNHRQLGVLDILSASLTLDNHLISELTATAKLPDPGLHEKNCGQQGKEGDPAPLLCAGDTSPGILCPDVESSEQKNRPGGACPEKSHRNDPWNGTLLL